MTSLFTESPTVLLEEFLSGEEATVTVMPPSKDRPAYWAMPVVVRFNHQEDIAPYNGITAVTENSRAISAEEAAHDPAYAEIQRQCETVARLLSVTAPIRIDVRRFKPDVKSKFALFDINMKPVSGLRFLLYFPLGIRIQLTHISCKIEYDRSWTTGAG